MMGPVTMELLNGICSLNKRRPDHSDELVREAFTQLRAYMEPEQAIDEAWEHADPACKVDEGATIKQRFVEMANLLDRSIGATGRDAYCLHTLGFTYSEIGKQLDISMRSVEREVASALTVMALKRQPRP